MELQIEQVEELTKEEAVEMTEEIIATRKDVSLEVLYALSDKITWNWKILEFPQKNID